MKKNYENLSRPLFQSGWLMADCIEIVFYPKEIYIFNQYTLSSTTFLTLDRKFLHTYQKR